MTKRAFSLSRFGVVLITSIGTICIAHAQEALEEVTVSAQKREQRLEDVGIAVTALSGADVKALRLRNLTDVAAQTPSLSVAAPLGESGNQNFTLRGVGLNDFSEHNESPVAAYQDGVYQGTIAGINGTLFDVDRVEVLRGPQGTLYGRNSTGGLVQFFSKEPGAVNEGYVDLEYGSFSSRRVEGAVGGPLGGPFQFRVAGSYNAHDGWGNSTIPGVRDPYGLDQSAGRVMLKWLGSNGTSVLLNVHGASNHSSGPAYTWLGSTFAADGWTQIATPANAVNSFCPPGLGVVGPGTDCFGYRSTHTDPWTFDNNRQPFQNLDTHGGSVTVEANVGEAAFTSITAYESVHKLYGEDTDSGPFAGLEVTNPVDSKQLTQELRLNSTVGQLVWTAGLFYFYRDIETGSRTSQAGVGFVDNEFSDELRSKSAAAFGQLEYSIRPTVTLIGGFRYSYEDQNFRILTVDHSGLTPLFLGLTSNPVPDYNVFPFTGGTTADSAPYRDSRIDNLVTYRAEVDWKPDKDSLVYGSISKGNKSAGWNVAIDGSGLIGFSTRENLPYSPEDLLAYEVGVKKLFRGVMRMRAAAFYYDYKNFQAFSFSGFTQQISNLPATVKGAELELTATPTNALELIAGASYLSTRVSDVVIPIANSPGTTITVDRHMVLAPQWSLNAVARYHFNVSTLGMIGLQLDTRYTGRQYFDLNNDPIATQNGQAITNGALYFTDPDSRVRVTAGVKNLTNRHYRTYTVPVTALGFEQQIFSSPRWYALTVGYTW